MENRILFVDDDHNILDAYRRKLRKIFNIETAGSVEEGMAMVKSGKRFPVIISDMRMPVMDGIQFLSRVKEVAPDSVCILLTGNPDLQKSIEALNGGNIFRFLTKPCEFDVLVKTLTDGIERYKNSMIEKENNEKIFRLSVTDGLTGCYNRTYLNEHLSHEIKRAKRYNHSLSIVLCDIDNFKMINDTFGHVVGDQVLKSFVQQITESFRKDVDWVARFGGEEFLIVLPETEVQGAFSLTERIRIRIARKAIDIEGKSISITASFGLTGISPDNPNEKTSPDFLIKEADTYLYQAKATGKNRIVWSL